MHLGGARQRGVLALLLLHANEAVASDRLIDEIWRDEPPADAPAALQAHVSRLRKLLGDPAVIRTTAAGYTVGAGPEELDLLRFRELVADGRRRLGAGDGAAAVLGEALALWRGDALADLRDQDFMTEPIRELDELQLEATELRMDADLEEGRHAEVVLELQSLVRRHPLRERLRAQLMLALYRSGRQAEALDAYSELRRTLDAELGLAPGPEVRELQAAMLRHDPELRPPSRRDRPRRRVAVAAVAAMAVAAAAAVALTAGGRPDPPAGGGFVAVVSPRSGAVEARVPVGNSPTALAVGGERTWVVNSDDQTVSRIDAGSHAVETFAIGAPPTDVAAGAGAVWVGRGGPQTHGVVTTALARLDPDTRAPRGTVALPRAGPRLDDAVAGRLALGAGALWAIAPDDRVLRIDPRSDRIGGSIPGVRASALAADGSALWALAPDGTVVKVDGRTDAVLARGRVQASAVASIAAGQGGAWVSAPADGAVWHATVAGDRLVMRTVAVPTGTTALAYGAGALWAVNPLRGTLAEIQGERLARTIAVGGYPRAVAAGRDAVWVASTGAAEPAAAGAGGVPGCGRPYSGGGGPARRLLVSDLPLQGGLQLSSQQMVDAMAYVLRRHGFRAGRWRVALQSCDDALASTRLPDATKCAANARAYARTPEVIAVLGPLNSDCARAAIPELARADDPLAMLSPFATAVGLTRPPTRTFLRVVPPDDQQIGALALVAAKRRGPVYVLDDGDEEYGRALATQFARAAGRLHLPVAGRASWNRGAPRRLAERVARAHPSAVFLGGRIDTGGPEVVKALRSRLGPHVLLLVPDGFTPLPAFTRRAGAASRGVLMALTGVAGVDQLGPAGRAFADDFRRTLAGAPLEPSAVYAAETMEVALDALARSDGTRASMRDALFKTRIAHGLVGPVRFDASGDIALAPITVLRVEPGARSTPGFPDVVVDSVQHVPSGLVR